MIKEALHQFIWQFKSVRDIRDLLNTLDEGKKITAQKTR